MKKIKLIVLAVLILSISFYGCAGVWWPHGDLFEELEEENIKTIAVLPMTNNNLDSNEMKEVNQYFMTGISKAIKHYYLISPEKCLEKLNRDSLTDLFYDQLAVYYSSKTLNKNLIREFGKSIGCDAIVFCEISNISESSYLDQYKASTSCWVSYRLYTVKGCKHIWGNLEVSNIKSGLYSGPQPLIIAIKEGIDRLFLYTTY